VLDQQADQIVDLIVALAAAGNDLRQRLPDQRMGTHGDKSPFRGFAS
jgi:hypothetical protein